MRGPTTPRCAAPGGSSPCSGTPIAPVQVRQSRFRNPGRVHGAVRSRRAGRVQSTAGRTRVAPEGAPATPPQARRQAAPRRRAPGVLLQRLSGPLNAPRRVRHRPARRGRRHRALPRRAGRVGGQHGHHLHARAGPLPGVRRPTRRNRAVGAGRRAPFEELFSASLAVPPGVADGAVLTPSALLRGMRPVSFRVRLRGAT